MKEFLVKVSGQSPEGEIIKADNYKINTNYHQDRVEFYRDTNVNNNILLASFPSDKTSVILIENE